LLGSLRLLGLLGLVGLVGFLGLVGLVGLFVCWDWRWVAGKSMAQVPHFHALTLFRNSD